MVTTLLLMGVVVCVRMIADVERGLSPVVITALWLSSIVVTALLRMGVVMVCVQMVADAER